MKKYDVIVIGSGGGTKISSPAANSGFKAAVIEKDKWGGTCLNRGCIPSKMLIHPATLAWHAREADKLQINIKQPVTFNVHKLVTRVNKVIDGETAGIGESYKHVKNLDSYRGSAKFLSDKVIEINGKKITAPKIVIAVGTRPSIPKIKGLEGTPYMTSTEALRNKNLPKKTIILGGGYIACELGHAYASFGSDVQFIVRSALLRAEDEEVQVEFTKKFSKIHKIHFGFKDLEVQYKNKTFTLIVTLKNGSKKKFTADALLVATGVTSNSDTLSLENTGIKTDSKGYVKVNNKLKTNVKGVYAIGDVIGKYLFRHSVNFEGEYLYDQLFGKNKKSAIKYPPMPHAVFSYPEIAGVGATEQELREKKIPYVKGVNPYISSAQGMARLPDHGFAKVLFHKKTRKLLGTHIIGDEAATMIHQAIYAMTYGATADNLIQMIYIHPAMSEIFRNAVRRAMVEF